MDAGDVPRALPAPHPRHPRRQPRQPHRPVPQAPRLPGAGRDRLRAPGRAGRRRGLRGIPALPTGRRSGPPPRGPPHRGAGILPLRPLQARRPPAAQAGVGGPLRAARPPPRRPRAAGASWRTSSSPPPRRCRSRSRRCWRLAPGCARRSGAPRIQPARSPRRPPAGRLLVHPPSRSGLVLRAPPRPPRRRRARGPAPRRGRLGAAGLPLRLQPRLRRIPGPLAAPRARGLRRRRRAPSAAVLATGPPSPS